MTANPLKSDAPRPGRVTVDTLHELASGLNREWWVQQMGRSYGVGIDAQGKHYLSWSNVRRGSATG